MRSLAAGLLDGSVSIGKAYPQVKALIGYEKTSAGSSRATIERTNHPHVKKSGQAALANRKATIKALQQVMLYLQDQEWELAAEELTKAASLGGKKSEKAARKTPTVALYVQYLAETDPGFQDWLAARGVKA